MIFDWFNLFNLTEFMATGLVSRTLTRTLEGIGNRDILITSGDFVGITYEGVFLCIDMADQNPFVMDGCAVYVDEDDNVWLGVNGRET